MPTLLQRKESPFVKMLLIGSSGTGKTGALASLVEAGYTLYIFDFDEGLDYLANHLAAKPNAEELLSRVHVMTFRDKLQLVGDEMKPVGMPKAFPEAMKVLNSGMDGSGPIAKLGPKAVVVIDSLTWAGQMAFAYHGVVSPTKDPRQTYNGAQQMILGLLSNLTSADCETNVIVSTHITMVELESGQMKGLPSAVGKAVSEKIPTLFNTMLEVRSTGSGATVKRIISTAPSVLVPTKVAVPKEKIPAELPIETGLATFFKVMRGE
jgi:hypothetical protein